MFVCVYLIYLSKCGLIILTGADIGIGYASTDQVEGCGMFLCPALFYLFFGFRRNVDQSLPCTFSY